MSCRLPQQAGVVGGGGKQHARLPAYYLVNAAWDDKDACWRLPLPATSILQLVWQRWEIEVTHRAMKTGFGVGEMQCWRSVSAVLSVQVHAWVFSTLMLAIAAGGCLGGSDDAAHGIAMRSAGHSTRCCKNCGLSCGC